MIYSYVRINSVKIQKVVRPKPHQSDRQSRPCEFISNYANVLLASFLLWRNEMICKFDSNIYLYVYMELFKIFTMVLRYMHTYIVMYTKTY